MAHLLADAVARCASALREAGIDSPDADAIVLIAHAAGLTTSEVRAGVVTGATIADAVVAHIDELTARRCRREPLQHITGVAAFRFLELQVGEGVFVPRPETEIVAQAAIDAAVRIRADGAMPLVIDLCSGSGAIALSVVTEVANANVIALEREPSAIAWLRRNADALPPDARARLTVVEGDVTDPSALASAVGSADVVVSNPPYVPPHEAPIQPEARHDPTAALYGGGADGLDVPRAVMAAAHRLLKPGGTFVMEHSSSQGADALAALAAHGGFRDATTVPDLAGLDRILLARRA